jgi:hypothetical protein
MLKYSNSKIHNWKLGVVLINWFLIIGVYLFFDS